MHRVSIDVADEPPMSACTVSRAMSTRRLSFRRLPIRLRLTVAFAGVLAAACTVATLAAIARGGIGAGAAVVVVAALLLFVRVAFRLVDEAERREEERAQQGPRLRGE